MGPDTMILVFWMLSFKPFFSLSTFTFIKRLFSSSSRSAIRVVSSAYLRLLIFLPAILIPACASSSAVRLLKAIVFPVVMYGCNSWTMKKAEQQRIDAFELWCWRRLLRVPWTAKRSNQFILKEISPGCSLEGLMRKLKFQYFGHWCEELTHWKRLWCWEGLGAGGQGDDRGWDGWMASLTRWIWVWVNSGS